MGQIDVKRGVDARILGYCVTGILGFMACNYFVDLLKLPSVWHAILDWAQVTIWIVGYGYMLCSRQLNLSAVNKAGVSLLLLKVFCDVLLISDVNIAIWEGDMAYVLSMAVIGLVQMVGIIIGMILLVRRTSLDKTVKRCAVWYQPTVFLAMLVFSCVFAVTPESGFLHNHFSETFYGIMLCVSLLFFAIAYRRIRKLER